MVHRICSFAAVAVLATLMPLCGADAGVEEIKLAPPDTRVEFTIYAMGLFPLAGHYTRFSGVLLVDPAHQADCSVRLDVEVGSLVMDDPGRVRLALGPKLLDQADFPHLLYAGNCGGSRAAGVLTLHGVSKPLELAATRDGQVVRAEGSLHRQDFGIVGLPGLIGGRITITFVARLPEDVARLVNP